MANLLRETPNNFIRKAVFLEGMKKLFWCVQQLDRLGGTETVSISLMNLLCEDFEVTLICTSKEEGERLYAIDPRIKIVNLGLPSELGRFDQYWALYGQQHKPFKRLGLLNKAMGAYVFGRRKTQKKIRALLDEDSFLIASSLDSYLNAPKKTKAKVFFHYHFDGPYFEKDRAGMRFARKPDRYVFLTDTTLKQVAAKHKEIGAISSYVYNPVKFEGRPNFDFHGGKIIFVGRFTEQKDPLLALAIAKRLHDDGCPFTLTMYGDGHLKQAMENYIDENGLTEVSLVSGVSIGQTHYLESDMLLITSEWEGLPLVKGEANACSLPVITRDFQGSIRETFLEGTDGHIIEGTDPAPYAAVIENLLLHPDNLVEAKKKAFDGSKRFASEAIKAKWLEILR